MGENVSVIIPAFNEEGRILQTLEGLKDIESISEIIVVDDGSTDSTYELLKTVKGITLIHNERNRGKGYAVKTALDHVKNKYVALLDADLCHSSSDVKRLIGRIMPGKKRMIIGKLPIPQKKGGFGIVRKVSEWGFFALTSKRPASLLSGQRVVPLDFLKNIDIPDGFGFEFKITLEGVKQGFELHETAVDMRHRETGRDVRGFLHRGRQCIDILRVIGEEIRNNRLRS